LFTYPGSEKKSQTGDQIRADGERDQHPGEQNRKTPGDDVIEEAFKPALIVRERSIYLPHRRLDVVIGLDSMQVAVSGKFAGFAGHQV
jgi:hypothetical protein